MTVAEAAGVLQGHPLPTCKPLITGGQVKAKQIGSDYRISKKVLDDFLSS